MRRVFECVKGAKMIALLEPRPLLVVVVVVRLRLVLLYGEAEGEYERGNEDDGGPMINDPWDRSEAPEAQGMPDAMSVERTVRRDESAAWPCARLM